jgi:hypothetical protein
VPGRAADRNAGTISSAAGETARVRPAPASTRSLSATASSSGHDRPFAGVGSRRKCPTTIGDVDGRFRIHIAERQRPRRRRWLALGTTCSTATASSRAPCCSASIATASRSSRLSARRCSANSTPLAARSGLQRFANEEPLPEWTRCSSQPTALPHCCSVVKAITRLLPRLAAPLVRSTHAPASGKACFSPAASLGARRSEGLLRAASRRRR